MENKKIRRPKISIREFHFPEDYSEVCTLWENAGDGIQLRRSDEPEELQKKLLRDPDLFLVVEADGCIAGTVIGGFDGRRGMIYHLAVKKEFRKQGLGSLLMSEVEDRLRDKGCIRCYLLVTTENKQAMRFYEKHQWQRMDFVNVYGKEL